MEDIDALKSRTEGAPKYKLSNANVFVSPEGYHYIDYLDPVEEFSAEIDASKLTEADIAYIERSLQSNAERFDNQVTALKRYLDLEGKRVLDIGCGGGLFLSRVKAEGAEVSGIELNDSRAHYATTKHGLEIVKRTVESEYWQGSSSGSLDAVTLWDVIEHVNYPLSTLKASANLLKKGGMLLLDTPCRDGFYHRFGALTYRLTGGRFPTLLNAMYSSHRFGHKQIFSTGEMRKLFEQADLEVLELNRFHELSFPYRFYLQKLLKSELLVSALLPLVHVALFLFPIKNKMFVVGRKV